VETPRDTLPALIAVPLLGAGVLVAWGSVLADPAAGVEAGFLALLVAGVGVAVAVLAPRPGWEATGGTLVAVLAGMAVIPGPARGAAVMATLALALGAAGARACRAVTLDIPVDGRRSAAVFIPLAIGLQLLARGGVLLDPPGFLRSLVVLLALPVTAGLAVAGLALWAGAARALAAGAVLFALGGGWWPGNVVAGVALAIAWGFRPARRPAATLEAQVEQPSPPRPRSASRPASVPADLVRGGALLGALALLVYLAPLFGLLCLAAGLVALISPALGGRVAAALGALALAVALAASYPWLQPRPLVALAALPGALFHSGDMLVGDGPPLTLDIREASYRRALNPAWPASAIALDTSLARAAGLPAGTPVATVEIHDADGRLQSFTLRVGSETGEWAARRPGLNAPAPAPLLAWIDPGRFFGQRYRAIWRLEPGFAVDRVELRRRPDLPVEVELTLFCLELRR
jgi:hypothetical protein